MMEVNVLPQMAFDHLKVAEKSHGENGKLTDEILLELYSLFGEPFKAALELLDNGNIIKFQTPDSSRCIFKVGKGSKRYTVYDGINFCHCKEFQHQVLELRNGLTCRHVLAVKLNAITSKKGCKVETITESQLVKFLNNQLSEQNLNDEDSSTASSVE